MAIMNDASVKRMHKDNMLSVLIGPFKFVIPVISYIVLYPLIISNSNMEVVGLWSLFATIVSFIAITDVGFSQLLTREAGPDRASEYNEVFADYIIARRSYVYMLIVLNLILITFSDYIFAPIDTVYSVDALMISGVLTLTGGFIQLTSKLDAAILTARHDNYIVQIVTGVTPALTYSTAIVGALVNKPIEGLAIGTVLTGLVTLIIFRFRLSCNHIEFFGVLKNFTILETLNRFFSLIRRGGHLYSGAVGMMLRQPIYKLIISIISGLEATAVFDIAMRVTQSVRGIITSGFSVLYPSFSLLYRGGERERIIMLVRVSLITILGMGAFALGLLMAVIVPLLSLWLGNYPKELVPAVKVLAIWQIITLVNVPFWYLLQASYNERFAAYSIWAHTAAIFLVIPFASLFKIGIVELLVYWALSSIFTQGFIYYYVQKKLDLFLSSINELRILVLVLLALVFAVFAYNVSPGILVFADIISYLVPGIVVYVIAISFIAITPIIRFVKEDF
jgi:O-antigen/teichoic acid export membrane protein